MPKQSDLERAFETQYTRLAGDDMPMLLAEYQFNPNRNWRVDFAFPPYELAIEIEGGVWTRGRHTRPSGYLKDIEKYNALAIMNWRLLRFTHTDIYDDPMNMVETIQQALGVSK